MDLNQKATEDLAKVALWSQVSLEYARERGQRKLIWLLEAVRVEIKLEDALLTFPLGEHMGSEREFSPGKGKAMQKNQIVAEMAVDVLARQAGERAKQTREPFEEALKAVLATEAGRQLGELRDGPHGDERAQEWQEGLAEERAKERREERQRRRGRRG